jgi:hypothetical protein
MVLQVLEVLHVLEILDHRQRTYWTCASGARLALILVELAFLGTRLDDFWDRVFFLTGFGVVID